MKLPTNHISEFALEGIRSTTLRRLGWAFLLAWVFCVFYTAALGGTSAERADGLGLLGMVYSVLPVASSVVTLVVVVAVEKRAGSPVQHSWAFWAAPAAATLSTPLLLVEPSPSALPIAIFALGAVLTGFGSGLLWVMWGEYYARISQEDAEFLAPASAFVAAIAAIVVSSMDGWVPIVVVSALPAVSGACLKFAWGDLPEESLRLPASVSDARHANAPAIEGEPVGFARLASEMGRPCFGILVACLLICIEGGMFPGSSESGNVQVAFIVAIAFMLLVGLSAISGPRRVSLAFLYRWMCPVLVVGYAAIVVLGAQLGLFVAYVVAIASRFAFCLITQMYFARYAVRGPATPVQAYGLGWISVHLGDMLGVFGISFVESGIAQGSFSLDQVSAVAMAVLVVATMLVLNDDRSFHAQATREEPSMAPIDETTDAPEPDEESLLNARIANLAAQAKLTPREVEVFGLLARGRSVPYIRDALVISRETAATHTKHIYAKLDVHSRQELIDLVRE